MDTALTVGIVAAVTGLVGAVAGFGAWMAAWYPARFRISWLVEKRGQADYRITNNTYRRADLLELSATDLVPEDRSSLEIDAPAPGRLEHGESLWVRTESARGVLIVWRRKIWYLPRLREYSHEVVLPRRLGGEPRPRDSRGSLWRRLLHR